MVKRQSRLLSLVAITVLLLLLAFANTSCMNNASTLYSQNTGKVFEIYSTQNIYNLLKLDTRNGKIWQVQFSVTDDAPRVVVPLNQVDLSSDNGKTVGRFSLHPTQNMYNFILLDQLMAALGKSNGPLRRTLEASSLSTNGTNQSRSSYRAALFLCHLSPRSA